MDITFLGATGTVTGSCYLLNVANHRVMIDCGLYQGLPDLEERNYTHPPVDYRDVEAILLTHAHLDHSGLIPRAVNLGFRGKIYAHPATVDLSEIMLLDAAEIQEHDAEWLSRKRARAGKAPVQPLYTRLDVANALGRFSRVEYEEPFQVLPGMTAEYHDAGHILGSSSIAVDCVENGLKRRVVFSGDIGHHQAPILREPLGFELADAVLMESTYGDRVHPPPAERNQVLRNVIREADRTGSKVLIPSFAIGRTQELLYILSGMLDRKEIPHIPIYLDSPMAISATQVHERHPECFDQETLDRIKAHENPFHPSTLHISRTVDQSRAINTMKGSMVIIAGGGMCEGGRIAHHLKHNLWNPANQLVFVGYQAEGTLGRFLQSGAKRVKILGEDIAVRAKLVTIDSFSAHADRDGLLDWLKYLKKAPQVLFLIHGEEKPEETLADTVRQQLGFQTYIPRLNQVIDLGDLAGVSAGGRIFAQMPLPGPSEVHEIAARVNAPGEERRPLIENYICRLAKRIMHPTPFDKSRGHDPVAAQASLGALSEAVDGDMGRLNRLIENCDKNPIGS
jgi:metallo-beta-lactamase family protein